ncbi:Hypothetical_protein [Hexamita inflata]|uniref:Hypothetical_protein n=1 Tax=Hexamita inflata TaxID=28002 RepID=A0AA86RA66_9EUKA|nr:Hypothetical protein HINF_LOCUS62329 [Hexamita inflata]
MRHIQNQLLSFQYRFLSSQISKSKLESLKQHDVLDLDYIYTYYRQNAGNMKQSQNLAVLIQKNYLENFKDMNLFEKSTNVMCILKPYLTETLLSSQFITQAFVNTSIFIELLNADKLIHILNFFTTFNDFFSSAQSNALRIIIIKILKRFSETSLSADCLLALILLKLIKQNLQQHQLEFLTQIQSEELARQVACNCSFFINSQLCAQVLWEINIRFNIMDIVNEALTNSKDRSYIISTLLELSNLLVKYGYEYKFSNQLTELIETHLQFKLTADQNFKFDKTIQKQHQLNLAVYIVSQVMSGVLIKRKTRECAYFIISQCECRTQNESEFISFCLDTLVE